MKMKKAILSLLLSAVSILSYSQFGIKAGVSASQMEDVDINRTPNVGFTGGFFLKSKIHRQLSITHEIGYVEKGKVIEDFRFKAHYIQGKAVFGFGPLRFGGYGSRLVAVQRGVWWIDNRHWINEDPNSYNLWDYGLVGGLNFNLRGANLDFQYQHGIPDMSEQFGRHRSVVATLEIPFKL